MKKTLIAILVATMALPAIARGPFGGPGPRHVPPPPRHGPVFHGHHHSMHTGDWLGFGLGVGILGVAAAAIASEPPSVVVSQPAPVIVQQPVVVAQPAPVVVQQPVVQTVTVVQPKVETSRQVITTQTTVNGVTTTTTRTRINYSDGTHVDL